MVSKEYCEILSSYIIFLLCCFDVIVSLLTQLEMKTWMEIQYFCLLAPKQQNVSRQEQKPTEICFTSVGQSERLSGQKP